MSGLSYRPVHWGTDSGFVCSLLNLCSLDRHHCQRSAEGTAQRAFWRAQLKTRQLQLLILRIGRDRRGCIERGWCEPDPETGRKAPLLTELDQRLYAAFERKSRASARADRLRKLLPKSVSLAEAMQHASRKAA